MKVVRAILGLMGCRFYFFFIRPSWPGEILLPSNGSEDLQRSLGKNKKNAEQEPRPVGVAPVPSKSREVLRISGCFGNILRVPEFIKRLSVIRSQPF